MKKRLLSFVTAFALTVAGLCILETEPVYAASIKISSAKDLLAMEEDPTGSYYLAKDITVPENTCLFANGTAFMGTLDGKGHKLKGYKSTEAPALFQSAKFAEFKNLSMTNVDIKVDGSAAALVLESDSCFFENVKVSGKIVSTGDGGDVGAIAARGSGSMEKCSNSAAITAKTKEADKAVGGLAGDFEATGLKNCSNSGAISLATGTNTIVMDGGTDKWELSLSGLTCGHTDSATGCKNSGNLTLKLNYKLDTDKSYITSLNGNKVNVSGICPEAYETSSCGNSGKIKVVSGKSAKVTGDFFVAGLCCWNAHVSCTASRCYNTGDVTVSGSFIGDNDSDGDVWIAGLFAFSTATKECYNTGNVNVTLLSGHRSGVITVGGVCGRNISYFKNCYNTGDIKVSNKGKNAAHRSGSGYAIRVGGLAGNMETAPETGSCSYSTGKVTYPASSEHGVLIGYWQGPFMMSKSLYYNNYYTKSSGPAYGGGDTSWKPYQPTAKKVSSITFGSCPKLSSKYWIYSSKHKRLILKNNKEK